MADVGPGAAAVFALVAFDAGVYFLASRSAEGELERRAEPAALLATAAALVLAAALGGLAADAFALALLWSRAAFDALHLGDGNILSIGLAPDYALYSMVLKLFLSGAFAVFVFVL